MPPHPPDRVFHGTTFDFESFDAGSLGRSVRNPTTSFGFYFSETEEDAASWVSRAMERGSAGPSPRIVTARLDIEAPIEISERRFRFYLQRARLSTIQRDLQAWQASGHDGMTTLRGGVRWWAVFDPSRIGILSSEPFEDWRARTSRDRGAPAAPDFPQP